ncbi:hypothetical protein CHH28_13900 [Bacterioplanes sanyensis]|uniref:Uncharacterized protein n=1 Tax=Bacterioplanes sanyensis TaxID=1249553 RepID=A0A222FLR0_9GAMM|nr:hypothetical protein [Bacterioplanes sanyensis]ASP39699.1 hypothetical protein CHH28_13900 [Bacterioplanes sanyensis]
MDAVIEYWPFWLIYLASAVIGLWCWGQCFFWLRNTEVRRFVYALGAVLLFTPAPAGEGLNHLAPALVVVPFAWLDGSLQQAMPAINWWLSALAMAVVLLALRALMNYFTRSEQSDQAQ